MTHSLDSPRLSSIAALGNRVFPQLCLRAIRSLESSKLLVAVWMVHIASALTCNAAEVSFNRDIRPILSDKCFFCHGPDDQRRESDLRLDDRQSASEVLESGELISRIESADADTVMPPPKSKLSLTNREKELLKQWIDQGSQYQNHWAFELLPDEVPVPSTIRNDWSKQTMDRFVLSRLEKENLAPSPAASPLRWLRRATIDLTGLPPTEDQIHQFQQRLAQDAEQAYETTVELLLQSPSFGEQMAVAWLDAARYADSYGYQSDKLNQQWPYRDWVVEAFNTNLPYDQFLTWQLAGDLLPDSSREQKLATAFNRIHRLNNEGGAVFEEWRIENVSDRVHTFGTAILGLTMECSRCHDHKYDPISMRDYYSLSAFFNSIDESGVYDRSEKVPTPSMLLPTEAQQAALDAARQNLRVAEQNWQTALQQFTPSQESSASREAAASQEEGSAEIPGLKLALGLDEAYRDEFKPIFHPSELDKNWVAMPDLVEVGESPIPRISSQQIADTLQDADASRKALVLDGERGITTLGVFPFDRWTPFTTIITLRDTKRVADRRLIAHHSRGTDCGFNGWDLEIVDGHLETRMYRVWPGNAIGVRTVESLPLDQWHQVAVTFDGTSKAAGLKIFVDGVPWATEILRDEMKKSANVAVDHGGQLVIGQRFRARGLDGGLIDDVRVYDRDLTESELRHLATGDPIQVTTELLASRDPAIQTARQQFIDAQKAVVMAEEVMDEIPVMIELRRPRPTHLLARGRYDAPTSDQTRVSRDVLSQIPVAFPSDAPRDRLGLARWVTDPRHPLTARVAVNRFWSQFFADPLVRTPENFGSQGELPTHPDLLDWLARDFVQHGWDVKRFCKQIVLSSTYRQDSRPSNHLMEIDPTNRLLARGPAHRLSAEQIRDLALTASGLMSGERGGPPVSPYQPGEDLWRESNTMSPPYQQSVGTALYRRSLYSVWKRTAPLPNMMALDATTREVCTVKRSRTNTPLQALVLLNDTQFVEASRVLAENLMSRPATLERIDGAFLRLAGRPADDTERVVLADYYEHQRDYFNHHLDEARQFVSVGASSPKPDNDPAQLAALTMVCQTILNLDATIWKR